MIKGSTLPITSGILPSSSVVTKVPVRIRFALKQKRLITASATILTPQTTPPLESAISITKGERAYKKKAEKLALLLNLFRDYGFEDLQIQKLMESRVVELSAEKLKPKIDCLVENGFTGELLHNLIVSTPFILLRSLDALKLNFQLLKQYLVSDDKVVTAINRYSWILHYDLKLYFIPNIELLINDGVPVNRVSHLLLLKPGVFVQSTDRMTQSVKTVKDFGIAPDDPMFIYCLRVVCQLRESNLKKKLDVFKSFGCSDEQVSNVFKKCPSCLGLSEEKLTSKLGYYLNTIKLEPETVFGNPVLLTYSVERFRARYEVLKILESEKLIGGFKVPSMVIISEDQFLKAYVIKHEESVPGLLDIYNDIAGGRKNNQG